MAVTVTIAGVSKKPLNKSLRINLKAGARNTCAFSVYSADGSYVPTLGAAVVVSEGATAVWSGSIDSIERAALTEAAPDGQAYNIECVSWEQRLDRRRCKHYNTGAVAVYTRNFEFTANDGTDVITATGHGRSAGAVVRAKSSGTLPAGLSADTDYYVINPSGADLQLSLTAGGSAVDITDTGDGTHVLMTYRAGEAVSDLLTNFADGEEITAADVDLGAVIDKAVFDARHSVWDAITSLATTSQYIAYIDVDKGLHFCPRTVTAAPFNVTNATGNFRNISARSAREDKVNTAMGQVAWAAFTPTAEAFNGDGSAISWDVPTPVADVVSMDVDGTEKTFGQYLVDSGKDFYWEYGIATIRQDAGGTVLSGGPPAEVLTVRYRALGADTVVAEDSTNITNTAAAEGGSGRYQRYYDRTSQVGAIQVLAEMDALVGIYKNAGQEVFYETDSRLESDAPLLQPGMLQTINVSELDLADDYLIDSIDITDVDGAWLKYRVRALSGSLTDWVDFFRALASGGGGGAMTGASGGTGGGGGGGPMPDPPDNFATCTVSVDTSGEKAKLTITLTQTDPPVDGVPTKAHIWLEIPDRSAGAPIILDGTYKLGDGGKLGGRWRGEDKGYFEWDDADPQPIVIEVDHVTESTPSRAWAVSAIEGAENELSTSISTTFSIDPPGVLKPNSGTAYGPNLGGISWTQPNKTDAVDGKDKTCTTLAVTDLPTAANFLGWEAVSTDWVNDDGTLDPEFYTHTGILNELTTVVENDTPARVMTVTFFAVACYQGADGAINRNPIVRGVTPSCTVTLGTTGGTISGDAIVNATITASKLGIAAITGDIIATATITANNIAAATITANEIANATITASKISNATITANEIANATITATQIQAATITGNEIAAAAIAAAHIQAATITAHEIAAGTITANEIAAATITGANIAAGAIAGANIAAGAIAGANIGAGAVTGANIAAATISGANLEAGAITAANIANLTITAAQIANLTINGEKIEAGAITGGPGGHLDDRTIVALNIATGAITATEIANATITATQIANATITGDKIANAQITGAHIQNGSITGDDIANATITGFKIASATITSDNIANATIYGSQIRAATITGSNIAAATITGSNIATATITGSNIQAASITATQIQALTITANEIANLTITGGKIANATITNAHIQDATITAAKIGDLSAQTLNVGTGGLSLSGAGGLSIVGSGSLRVSPGSVTGYIIIAEAGITPGVGAYFVGATAVIDKTAVANFASLRIQGSTRIDAFGNGAFANIYTKAEIDALLAGKANVSHGH